MAKGFFSSRQFISVIAMMWVLLLTHHCSAFSAALLHLCICEEMSCQGGATLVAPKIDLKAMWCQGLWNTTRLLSVPKQWQWFVEKTDAVIPAHISPAGVAFTHRLWQEGCRWLFLCWTPAGITQLTHHQMCCFCVLPCASDSISERHICCWIIKGRSAIWHPPRWWKHPDPLGGCSSALTLAFPWVCIFFFSNKAKKQNWKSSVVGLPHL